MIQKYPKFNEHFPFINCSISDIKGNVLEVAKRCAQENSVSIDDLVKCANSSLGNQLLYGSGLLTESLQPQRNYVPWIVVNSQHTNVMQTQAESDLVKYICKEYKGQDLPSECKAYLNHSSNLRAERGVFSIPLIISFIILYFL
jgi:interferon gamma-inducible protein 30